MGGAAVAVGLALTLPAWDALAAANDARGLLEAELALENAEAAALPALKTRFTALKRAADGPQVLDEAKAEELRESVRRNIAAAGCRYRRLTLDPPVTIPWPDGPPPLPGLVAAPRGPAAGAGNEPPARFELVTRRLEAEAVGSAAQIAELLAWASAARPHLVAVDYELSFEEAADPAARAVHLTFTLLLTGVQPAPGPAAG